MVRVVVAMAFVPLVRSVINHAELVLLVFLASEALFDSTLSIYPFEGTLSRVYCGIMILLRG